MFFLFIKKSQEEENGNTQSHWWIWYIIKQLDIKEKSYLSLESWARGLWLTLIITDYDKHKCGEKYLLCVYMFLVVFVPACRYSYRYMAYVRKPVLFFCSPHLIFWDKITHWIWSSLIQPDWLASKAQGDIFLSIWRAGTTGTDHCAGLLCEFKGSELNVSCLKTSILPKDQGTETFPQYCLL